VHEFAVCQSLLTQVETLAQAHGARQVSRILLRIGPLSGIELPLLAQAFTVAQVGTVAANAMLEAESAPIRVHCRSCGADSDAAPNRLLCAACGDWRTDLISGDELLLASVELELTDEAVE